MKKIFSIIIPAYNCAESLKKTLDSIIVQNTDLYECIIVDGKSVDKTLDIIMEFKKRYPNNIKFISESDEGLYDAMNKGIKLAIGDYLYFIGAGDVLYPDVLTNVSKYLVFNLEIVYGNVYMCHQKRFDGFERNKEDMLHSIICHQSIFYNKDIFVKHGLYDLSYKVYADTVLNYKVFGDDLISKRYINVDIAKYLGGGFSEKNHDTKYEEKYAQIVLNAYGYELLYNIFKEILNCKNGSREFVGWCTSTGYQQIKNKVNLEYLIDSDKKKWNTFLDNYKIFSPEEFIEKSKIKKPYVLIFSNTYYYEISNWLTANGFTKYKDYSQYSLSFSKVIDEIGKNII